MALSARQKKLRQQGRSIRGGSARVTAARVGSLMRQHRYKRGR